MELYKTFNLDLANKEDNSELLLHLKRNPIHMEVDYYKDKMGNFFTLSDFLPQSKVLVAKNQDNAKITACVTFLMLEGKLNEDQISFQYITDLIKDRNKTSDPLLMKELLNHGLRNHFTTDLIFGLINEKNKRARIFSKSEKLIYKSQILATMNYYEILPLKRYRIAKEFSLITPKDNQELQTALDYINNYYNNHLLFKPLDLKYLNDMFKYFPDFDLNNITMLYTNANLKGVMITYNPGKIVAQSIAKMDFKTKLLTNVIRTINKLSGLLFAPPKEGEHINTLNIRYLAGDQTNRGILLRHANNIAKKSKLHSITLLMDEREKINIPNKFAYQFKSLIYSAYKNTIASKIQLFKDKPVFFDISFS